MGEILSEKRQLSCRVLAKAIELVEQMPQAIELEQEDRAFPLIRDYFVKMHEILSKYCKRFQLVTCDRQFEFPHDLRIKFQIILLSTESLYLMRAMKRNVNVKECMANTTAQDLIFHICRKINAKIEQYLVNIHYWHEDLVAAGYEVY